MKLEKFGPPFVVLSLIISRGEFATGRERDVVCVIVVYNNEVTKDAFVCVCVCGRETETSGAVYVLSQSSSKIKLNAHSADILLSYISHFFFWE